MFLKTRAKNFCPEEITAIVDLVQENKSKPFGGFSASLTFEEKNKIWEDIANALNETYEITRTKEDVSKKWSNILYKYKPRISDEILSANKTGGGPAQAELSELELKIQSTVEAA